MLWLPFAVISWALAFVLVFLLDRVIRLAVEDLPAQGIEGRT